MTRTPTPLDTGAAEPTDNSAYPDAYGKWSGRPSGVKPDFKRCCAAVSERGRGWGSVFQCTRKRGFGPGAAYCKQHDPAAVRAREAASTSRSVDQHNSDRVRWHGGTFLAALRQIAAGHNDARELAQQVIDKFDQGARE